MTLQVTLAAPQLHGAPHHHMVGAVEAVVMMTMAAVPEMALAVVTVTPAVGATNTHLAAVSVWADRRGAQLPLWREVTLLVIHTTAQVVEGHVVAAVAADLIEEWVATDIELDLERHIKTILSLSYSLSCTAKWFWKKSEETCYPFLNLWTINISSAS